MIEFNGVETLYYGKAHVHPLMQISLNNLKIIFIFLLRILPGIRCLFDIVTVYMPLEKTPIMLTIRKI